MKIKKIVKKVGDSIGIIFNKEEREVYNLNVDDIIEIDVIKVDNEPKTD